MTKKKHKLEKHKNTAPKIKGVTVNNLSITATIHDANKNLVNPITAEALPAFLSKGFKAQAIAHGPTSPTPKLTTIIGAKNCKNIGKCDLLDKDIKHALPIITKKAPVNKINLFEKVFTNLDTVKLPIINPIAIIPKLTA